VSRSRDLSLSLRLVKNKKKSYTAKSAEVHTVVRHKGSHIFWIIGSQMAVRLSASCAGHPLPPGIFLVVISVRSRIDPRDMVWLEVLCQLKNPITSSGIEPASFRLIAQYLN
jgi:hypothetical protein